MSKKKVAIVTGAGQGLGRAIAEALHASGIIVASVGRTAEKVHRTTDTLGGQSIAIAADLIDPEQISRTFETVTARLGGVDILVNCAGEWDPFPFPEATDAQITNMIAQCLTSPMFCMREAISRRKCLIPAARQLSAPACRARPTWPRSSMPLPRATSR